MAPARVSYKQATWEPRVTNNPFNGMHLLLMNNRNNKSRVPDAGLNENGSKQPVQRNAFSLLMNNRSNKSLVPVASKPNRKKKRPWSRRLASSRNPSSIPHYKLVKVGGNSKRLQPIVVDGFQYSSLTLSRIYFLSHFHSDHYIGLRKTFSDGTIYCAGHSKLAASPIQDQSCPCSCTAAEQTNKTRHAAKCCRLV